jgi:hypothetical protein
MTVAFLNESASRERSRLRDKSSSRLGESSMERLRTIGSFLAAVASTGALLWMLWAAVSPWPEALTAEGASLLLDVRARASAPTSTQEGSLSTTAIAARE